MLETRDFAILNQDSPDEDLKNGECRELWNMTHQLGGFGLSKKLEIIQGTLEKVTNLLPTIGTNKTIGAVEDQEQEVAYYCIANTSGFHGVYEYTGRTGTIVKIMETSYLAFDMDRIVTGTVVDGMLFLTDDIERPLYINVAYAKAGSYVLTRRKEIEYHRPQPVGIPVATHKTGGTNQKLFKNSYKFAFQLVYFDDGVSRISHFSKLVAGSPITQTGINRYIEVQINLDVGVFYQIKTIRLLYQKNNDGNYYQFKEIEATGTDLSYTYNFTGTEPAFAIPSTDLVDIQEAIPSNTRDFEIKDNRLFMPSGKIGYDDRGVDVALSVTVSKTGPLSLAKLKRGGSYSVGIIWEDIHGWRSPVQAETSIQVPYDEVDAPLNLPQGYQMNIMVNGTAPSWAIRSHVVVSKEQEYLQFLDCPTYIMPVIGKKNEDSAPGGITEIGDWRYYNDMASAVTVASVHLKIPSNVPFNPEVGMFVRFKDDVMIAAGFDREAVIVDVVGDKVYIDNMGSFNWSAIADRVRNIEVYSKNEVITGLFHEVGLSTTIAVNPNPAYIWYGDIYTLHTLSFLSFVFENEDTLTTTQELDLYGVNFPQQEFIALETPSPVLGSPTGSQEVEAVGGYNSVGAVSLLTFDYTKIDSDRSVAYAAGILKEVNSPDVVIFSDPYVQNSKINGLFNVPAGNSKTLGAREGPITALKDVGEDALIAIHERGVTTLYIGRGVIRTTDDDDIVTTTDSVVGYKRRLQKKHGSKHPESIAYDNDKVWAWDHYRAEVIRYAANGIEPLGQTYDFKSYLEQIVEARTGFDYKAFGAYYPDLEEYYLSFPEVVVDQVVVASKITIRFSEKYKAFDGFYDFYPDFGHKIGSRLLFWKDGKTYLWQKGTDFTFFGVPYSPKIIMIYNGENTILEKVAQSFMAKTTKPWRLDLEAPSGAATYIGQDEWEEKYKFQFSQDVLRDINSLGTIPDPGDARLTGDTIRGETFKVTLTRIAVAGDEAVEIDSLTLAFQVLAGQVNVHP